jgi:acyl-CoA thioester hydrolase
MYTHELKIRVRYGETDCMGVVYHANYVNYYEIARTEMLRAAGNYSYRDMEADGVMMPVIEVQSRYFKAAFYDEELTIRTTLREMPTSKITFHYEIFNERAELINSGAVTLAFMRRESRRPCRPPEKLMNILKPYMGASM